MVKFAPPPPKKKKKMTKGFSTETSEVRSRLWILKLRDGSGCNHIFRGVCTFHESRVRLLGSGQQIEGKKKKKNKRVAKMRNKKLKILFEGCSPPPQKVKKKRIDGKTKSTLLYYSQHPTALSYTKENSILSSSGRLLSSKTNGKGNRLFPRRLFSNRHHIL